MDALNTASLPVRGAWIEIVGYWRRWPGRESLPVRGAWIEIHTDCVECWKRWSLPVRGAWIEIGLHEVHGRHAVRRSPCGERGLKLPLPYKGR